MEQLLVRLLLQNRTALRFPSPNGNNKECGGNCEEMEQQTYETESQVQCEGALVVVLPASLDSVEEKNVEKLPR